MVLKPRHDSMLFSMLYGANRMSIYRYDIDGKGEELGFRSERLLEASCCGVTYNAYMVFCLPSTFVLRRRS